MTILVTAVGHADGDVLTVENEEGVWKTPVVTDLAVATKTATTLDVTSSTGTDATLPAATETEAGLFPAAAQVKLDGIEAGAVAAGTTGDAFATSHLSAFAHGDIATALQPGDVGSAAYADTDDFATAAQGSTADSAVQPGDLAAIATSGAAEDVAVTLSPTRYTAATADVEAHLTGINTAVGAAQFVEDSSAPTGVAYGCRWQDTTSGLCYTYIANGGDPAWVEL